ncbi:MAG: hypothetical protein AB7F99_01055 [Vicinamibacterales bacterium]
MRSALLRTVLAVLVVAATMTSVSAEVIERLLATASGQLIMASDVAAVRRFGLAPPTDTDRQVVEQLVNRALILSEVDRYAPPEPPEEVIAAGLARVRGRFASEEAFQTALRELGLDEGVIRGRIRQDMRIEAYLSQRFVVAQPSEEEIAAAYKADPRFAGASAPTLDAVRDEIARGLVDERRTARVTEWVNSLRNRSRVAILLDADGSAQVSE